MLMRNERQSDACDQQEGLHCDTHLSRQDQRDAEEAPDLFSEPAGGMISIARHMAGTAWAPRFGAL